MKLVLLSICSRLLSVFDYCKRGSGSSVKEQLKFYAKCTTEESK